MGYCEALKAAGAKVEFYEEVGSYQGDWYAFVEYEGRRGLVHSSYGSCSGCDAYQDAFSWFAEEEPNYQERLAEFGRGYLGHILTRAEAEKLVEDAWESDRDEVKRVLDEIAPLWVSSAE